MQGHPTPKIALQWLFACDINFATKKNALQWPKTCDMGNYTTTRPKGRQNGCKWPQIKQNTFTSHQNKKAMKVYQFLRHDYWSQDGVNYVSTTPIYDMLFHAKESAEKALQMYVGELKKTITAQEQKTDDGNIEFTYIVCGTYKGKSIFSIKERIIQ